jgi:hypothetical protein
MNSLHPLTGIIGLILILVVGILIHGEDAGAIVA